MDFARKCKDTASKHNATTLPMTPPAMAPTFAFGVCDRKEEGEAEAEAEAEGVGEALREVSEGFMPVKALVATDGWCD